MSRGIWKSQSRLYIRERLLSKDSMPVYPLHSKSMLFNALSWADMVFSILLYLKKWYLLSKDSMLVYPVHSQTLFFNAVCRESNFLCKPCICTTATTLTVKRKHACVAPALKTCVCRRFMLRKQSSQQKAWFCTGETSLTVKRQHTCAQETSDLLSRLLLKHIFGNEQVKRWAGEGSPSLFGNAQFGTLACGPSHTGNPCKQMYLCSSLQCRLRWVMLQQA